MILEAGLLEDSSQDHSPDLNSGLMDHGYALQDGAPETQGNIWPNFLLLIMPQKFDAIFPG